MKYLKTTLMILVSAFTSQQLQAGPVDDCNEKGDAGLAKLNAHFDQIYKNISDQSAFYESEKKRGVLVLQLDMNQDGILEPEIYKIDAVLNSFTASKTAYKNQQEKLVVDTKEKIESCLATAREAEAKAEAAKIAAAIDPVGTVTETTTDKTLEAVGVEEKDRETATDIINPAGKVTKEILKGLDDIF